MSLFGYSLVKNNKDSPGVLKQLTGLAPGVHTTDPEDFLTERSFNINFSSFNNNRDLLLHFFNNVSEINALITYIAQKAADIPVKHVQLLTNGKEKDISSKSTILPLLAKPNQFSNGRQFAVNCFSSFFVFGYIPINLVRAIGWKEPSEMYCFPGNQFYPIPQKTVNQYGLPPSGIDYRLNPIVKYRLFIDARPFDFSPDEILMINDSNLSFVNGQYMTGQSRLQSAIRSIETLSYIYDTVNTLIANKGAEGFVFKRSRAGEVDSGWDEKDKDETMRRLYSFGTTGVKKPIFVTTKDLGFTRISVPVGDFMPIEIKEHEFRTLSRALGVPSVLLNDTKASTYNNMVQAEKALYTNTLMSVVNSYYEALTNGFGLIPLKEALRADFADIECLQSDRKSEAETNKVWNEVLKDLQSDSLITPNQRLEILGLPAINKPEYNKLKIELEAEKPPGPIDEEPEIDTTEDTNTNENNGEQEDEPAEE